MARKKSASKKSSDNLTRRDVALMVRDARYLGETAIMLDALGNPTKARNAARKAATLGLKLIELGKSAGRWRNFITAQVLLMELDVISLSGDSFARQLVNILGVREHRTSGDILLR